MHPLFKLLGSVYDLYIATQVGQHNSQREAESAITTSYQYSWCR